MDLSRGPLHEWMFYLATRLQLAQADQRVPCLELRKYLGEIAETLRDTLEHETDLSTEQRAALEAAAQHDHRMIFLRRGA